MNQIIFLAVYPSLNEIKCICLHYLFIYFITCLSKYKYLQYFYRRTRIPSSFFSLSASSAPLASMSIRNAPSLYALKSCHGNSWVASPIIAVFFFPRVVLCLALMCNINTENKFFTFRCIFRCNLLYLSSEYFHAI